MGPSQVSRMGGKDIHVVFGKQFPDGKENVR
jgi:hypothetical protein